MSVIRFQRNAAQSQLSGWRADQAQPRVPNVCRNPLVLAEALIDRPLQMARLSLQLRGHVVNFTVSFPLFGEMLLFPSFPFGGRNRLTFLSPGQASRTEADHQDHRVAAQTIANSKLHDAHLGLK
jgi:hypothetical protein